MVVIQKKIPIFCATLLSACGIHSSESSIKDRLTLTAHVYDGRPDLWPEDTRHSITYCVSNTFGPEQSRVVTLLNDAITEWETVAGVNYTHDTSQDNNCDAANSNVTFNVSPVSGQGYLMRAFFPSSSRPNRELLVDSSSYQDTDQAVRGFFRHEIGHTLGFRHEHVRSTGCTESGIWEAVTEYDAASVMHYPHCPGGTGDLTNLVLTDLDRRGASKLYP